MSGDGIPVTWPELLGADLDLLREDVAAIDDVPVQFEGVRPPWLKSGKFSSPSLTLAQGAVVFGSAACRKGFGTLLPLLPVALRDFESGITNTNRAPAQHLLSFFNTAKCCGVELPSAAKGAARHWPALLVPFVRLMSDTERQTVALAAIVAGEFDLVPSMVGGGALEMRLTAGATFDFNMQAFVRYLTVASRARVTFADVEPAWLNFVERFPHKRAAGTLDWADLLYAARIVDALRPDRPAGTIADMVHQLVAGYR